MTLASFVRGWGGLVREPRERASGIATSRDARCTVSLGDRARAATSAENLSPRTQEASLGMRRHQAIHGGKEPTGRAGGWRASASASSTAAPEPPDRDGKGGLGRSAECHEALRPRRETAANARRNLQQVAASHGVRQADFAAVRALAQICKIWDGRIW